MRIFDEQELASKTGKDGGPVYITYEGKVYDVTGSKLWKNGTHMRIHHAGPELKPEMNDAPHDAEVLERFPLIGTTQKETPAPQKEEESKEIPDFLVKILERWPILRRHVHPMAVHFPIVFFIAAPFFLIVYLETGADPFELTALHCLFAAVLFSPIAIATGYYTWWLNYETRPLRQIIIKQRLSWVLFALSLLALGWRISSPGLLAPPVELSGIIYALLVSSFAVLVTIIGYYGGQLTFPYK